MAQIGVSEAAALLGVGSQRIRQRIADGSLPAEKIGSQYVVDEADLLPLRDAAHRPGRPLSERSALSLLVVAEPDRNRGLALLNAALAAHAGADLVPAPNDRTRARKRLMDLIWPNVAAEVKGGSEDERAEQAAALRKALANRASRHLYRAATRDLDDLRADERLRPAGLSAPESGIASGDLVEGYVSRDEIADVVSDYLLDEAPAKRANVVLHASSPLPLIILAAHKHQGHAVDVPRSLLLAADLAEHRDPRSEKRALDLLFEAAAALSPDPIAGGDPEGNGP